MTNFTMTPATETMVDLPKADELEIVVELRPDGTYRLWVNGKERCHLRAYRIQKLRLKANGKEYSLRPTK